MTNELAALKVPFPPSDIEWRISRSGTSHNGVFAHVLAYITARAIAERLDDAVGPANWRNEPLQAIEVRPGLFAMQTGISIRVGDEWITKWDCSEPTHVEAAKGGFSGAMKRAGAQWGIGRYLYHLTETFAEVSTEKKHGWNWAKLKEGTHFWWKPPELPPWALPKEPETEVSQKQLNELKRKWKSALGDGDNAASLARQFGQFVVQQCGEFPHDDFRCWSTDALQKCEKAIERNAADPGGPDGDIPFSGEDSE